MLVDCERKALAKNTRLTPEDRAQVLYTEEHLKFSKIEESFRKDLVKRKVYTESTLPEPKHCSPDTLAPQAPSQAISHAAFMPEVLPAAASVVKVEMGSVPATEAIQSMPLTELYVRARLEITALPQAVLLRVEHVAGEGAKAEEEQDEASGLMEVTGGSQPSHTWPEGSWTEWTAARLISLDLPWAMVDLPGELKVGSITCPWTSKRVHVDFLLPYTAEKETVKPIHPSIQVGGRLLDAYDYDLCQGSFFDTVFYHACLCGHICRRMHAWKVLTLVCLARRGSCPSYCRS